MYLKRGSGHRISLSLRVQVSSAVSPSEYVELLRRATADGGKMAPAMQAVLQAECAGLECAELSQRPQDGVPIPTLQMPRKMVSSFHSKTGPQIFSLRVRRPYLHFSRAPDALCFTSIILCSV